ncbi:MAG TPA: hypothetical protein VM008_00985 [Phycisphaerae bacterium]|nr:hypothetical protein [Phycisphaerae bacterium]
MTMSLESPDTSNADSFVKIAFQNGPSPIFALPDLSRIQIKKRKPIVAEADVEKALENIRAHHGTFVKVDDRGAQKGDVVQADVHGYIDDEEVIDQDDYQFAVADDAMIQGFSFVGLVGTLEGAIRYTKRSLIVVVPQAHPDGRWRGKQLHLEFFVKEVRHLQPAELNGEFLQTIGFSDLVELKCSIQEELEGELAAIEQDAARDQLMLFLLNNTAICFPSPINTRQMDHLAKRKAVEQLRRGLTKGLNFEPAGEASKSVRDISLSYILPKLADTLGSLVPVEERDAEIAKLANQRGKQPEEIFELLQAADCLIHFENHLRELRALDCFIASAEVCAA